MAPKRNGFMQFTLQWKAKYADHLTLPQATQAAGNIWAKMGEEERAPYIAKAKEVNAAMNADKKTEKKTCTRTPLSTVEKEKLESERKEREMKRDIESTVNNSVKSDELSTQTYFFIMVNYFTKTLKGGVYVPAELAVSEFSLKRGVNRIYQTLINPGVNIYGHQYEAQHHSDSTHKLPLPPNALGEKNLGRIYNDILNFIRSKNTNEYPPLYTNRDCIHIVESVLEFLKADVGANNIDLKIYPIQYLLYIMKEATSKIGEVVRPKNIFITDAFFERDFFEYYVGLACEYHESLDQSKYCTKSFVTRWGYMFADYMCGDIAIDVIPGRHHPADVKLQAMITPAPSVITDNTSFISMDTASSCATKPVAGSKIYLDNQKSAISDSDHNETSLCAHKKSKKNSTKSKVQRPNRSVEGNVSEGDEYGTNHLNPWTNRSRVVPREPNGTYFTIDYVKNQTETDDYNSVASFGRGRGSLINSSLNSSNATFSTGRGRFPGSKK